MTRTLVACWSRTGHTRKVAEGIASALGADLEEIAPVNAFGLAGIAAATLAGRRGSVSRPRHDPAGYDLVVLGTPVWFMKPASPVLGFAARHAGGMKRVAFFCTEGGKGEDAAFRRLADACGRKPEATLAVTEAELKAGADAPKIAAFVRRLSDPPAGAP